MFFKHGHKFTAGVCVHCQCLESSEAAHVHCPKAVGFLSDDPATPPLTMPGLDPLSMAITSAVDAANEDPASRPPIRAHVEGCPDSLRTPVDRCACGGRDVRRDVRADPELAEKWYLAMVRQAEADGVAADFNEPAAIKENEPHALTAAPPCSHCGGPHPFDTSIPSPTWNAVIRAANLPDYLCLPCIVQAFVAAGESFTATLWSDTLNGTPIEVIIGGQRAIDAARLSGENSELRVQARGLTAPSRRPAGDVALRAGDVPDAGF